MPPHSLPAGLQVLSDLEELALALGYSVVREHVVAGTGAAVDLAWFAADDRRVPLMIYEIESSASASMANNAMKVFSKDVDDFVKPLFFFHLLLSGGADNARIAALRRTWGTYNYRVYRLNDVPEISRLVSDILGQHRRVTGTLDIVRLMSALWAPTWVLIDVERVFEVIERLDFDANYLGDLTRLAARDTRMHDLYSGRLRRRHLDNEAYPGTYDTYLGDNFSSLIEIALLASTGDISDEVATELLDAWQHRGSIPMDTIGPYLGLSVDYDQFILGAAPYVMAVSAALLSGKLSAKEWIACELAALIERLDEMGVPRRFTTCGRIWLVHIAVSTIREFMSAGRDQRKLLDIYRLSRDRLQPQIGTRLSTSSGSRRVLGRC